MYKNNSIKSFVFFSRSGCLLPLLIILNLLFGWLFLKFWHWLIIEAILVLLFIFNIYIIARKIFSTSSKRNNVIDVKAEVVEEKCKLNQVDFLQAYVTITSIKI